MQLARAEITQMARILDPREIVETTDRLEKRIQERFPTSNLGQFAGEVAAVARKAELRTRWIGRPLIPLRIAVTFLILLIVGLFVIAVQDIPVMVGGIEVPDIVQSFEALMSSLGLIGAAVFFLITSESRVKRARAVRAIRELRVMAHLVDMHQLVKDPKDPRLTGVDTASSPRSMSLYELYRYLDYCSELLSLLSKIAALYVNELDDRVVLDYVESMERLVQGLSDKIWRKMSMVDRLMADELPAAE